MDKKILIPDGVGFLYLNPSQILYCRAKGRKTEVYLENSKVIEVPLMLKSIEERTVEPSFFRCHRSYVINMDWITSINGNFTHVTLKDTYKVPVSKRIRPRLYKVLNCGLFQQ